MPNKTSTLHATAGGTNATSAGLQNDLRAIFAAGRSYGGSADVSPEFGLGLLAGLLIAKWAACDESEREALAAFDERAFKPGLPDALRLSVWDTPRPNHADTFTEALWGMTTGSGAESVAARYVTHVAPLIIRAVESSREMYERLLGWVRRLDLGTADGRTLAAHLFDDLLRLMLDKQGKEIGEFVTPEPVAALMLSLANPKSGDRIYDPCFGFGELLVGAVRRLSGAVWFASPNHQADVQVAGVFGVEVNRVAYVVGLCRVLLAGVDHPGIDLGDALERPLPRNRTADGFDCILAAPPWGGRKKHPSAGRFPFPSRNTESLFLQHIMANLRPGGRAVVVLPEIVLFRNSDWRLRKMLLSEYSVHAVVSLPDGAFSPWTGVAASLVVFRRAKPRPTVRFVSISPQAWEGTTGDDGGARVRDEGRSESHYAGAYEPGFSDGGAAGGGAGSVVAKPGEGVGSGKRRVHRFELLWLLSDLLQRHRKVPAGPVLPGVEVWEAPILDLAQRDYELIAKKSGSEALNAELDRLVALDPSLKVERLERIAEVFTGKFGGRRYTTERLASDVVMGLLRARDVRDVMKGVWGAGILSPTLFLTEEGESRMGEKFILRPLDVVVAMSGATGNIAFIPEPITTIEMKFEPTRNAGSSGIPAPITKMAVEDEPIPNAGSNGVTTENEFLVFPVASRLMPVAAARSVAIVRMQAGLEPQFLATLLRSSVYRHWLSGHARGVAIQRLSLRTLRKLKIPVPPLPVQIAVLDETANSERDAMAVLVRLLSRAANEPVAVWLETPAVAWLESGMVGGEPARGMKGPRRCRRCASIPDRPDEEPSRPDIARKRRPVVQGMARRRAGGRRGAG